MKAGYSHKIKFERFNVENVSDMDNMSVAKMELNIHTRWVMEVNVQSSIQHFLERCMSVGFQSRYWMC